MKSLKAWKLRKRYRIRISPTDDLAQHLVYNHTTGTLSVFRQVTYLKAQLRHSSDMDISTPASTSIPRGTLPPQLLLETLYTIYFILIPLFRDPTGKSHRLAKKLVKGRTYPGQEKFDPDLLIYDGLIRQKADLDDFKLVYWAKRIRALQGIVHNPPPSYKIISWIERHTSERNALTVAFIGVFLAVLFGLLGLMVGIAQLVVSILAWKNPVSQS
ncbi:hypothetical protein QBC34DRAFT_378802 [Podospora aff. communis PSN243]|uniref:Uncharacterized protein n=1 Tax=Podospora aff. communis PSN243 TaxID=3040156 RepID=A0AAV9GRV8_9PEZI|nr:hypothetical protein QBC34DRAFT_378802 [Podospora aff. communis PSN243]